MEGKEQGEEGKEEGEEGFERKSVRERERQGE